MNARSRAVVLLLPIAVGCSTAAPRGPSPAPATNNPRADTAAFGLVPAGYGSLRQDDIAVRVRLPAVLVRAIPLDESLIRLLSPDSYRALHELREGKRAAIDRAARRDGVRAPSLWYISFYGLEPDARFNPLEVVITSGGRDFRPLDVVPLSTGFGEQRLSQREVQSAIYLFDAGIDVAQPLTVSVESVPNSDWGSRLRTIERERSIVRARSGQTGRP